MKKKEIKKTKLKPRKRCTEKQLIAFVERINSKFDWMIMLLEVWSIKSEIKELKDKLTNEIDLRKLPQLKKRADAIEKTLQDRRSSIFSHRTI